MKTNKNKSSRNSLKKKKKIKKNPHQRPNNKGLSFVKNLKDLKNLLNKGFYEYRIALAGTAGAVFSRKSIWYNPKNKKPFEIWNHIDDTEQRLTEKQLMNKEWTNIGLALRRHSLIVNLNEKLNEEDIPFTSWPCGCTDKNCKPCANGICEHE